MKYLARKVIKKVCVDAFGKIDNRTFIEFYKTESEEVKEGFKSSAKAKKVLSNKGYRADFIYCLSEEMFNIKGK